MFDINKIKIPTSSGVYLMKNQQNKIIYIGKAKNLSKRVKSYFQKNDLNPRIQEMVNLVSDIDFMITGNEMEALILEARLIKQHRPKYNIDLKDSSRYMYLKITNEQYPRLISTYKIANDGAKYFGPYPFGKSRKLLMLTVARLFGLRVQKINSNSARELYKLLQDNKFSEIDKKNYKNNVRLAEIFLKGRKDKAVKILQQKMKTASKNNNFELAKLCKDQIDAIIRLSDKQLISLPKSYDQDFINYVLDKDKLVIQVFNVSKGLVSSRKNYVIKGDCSSLSDFIFQYYLTRPIPKEIVLPDKLLEQVLVNKYLNKLKGKKVVITVPKRGDKKKLLELVRKNILLKVDNVSAYELKTILDLDKLPLEIDGFDISNLGDKDAVGSCVHFSSGGPNKKLYRRFKIKTVVGQNDFAMMKEVLQRRYSHANWAVPDLILIDGGPIQLQFAKAALSKLKLNIPIISLAKREEEIYCLGKTKPIILDKKSPALKLLQQIRDESHRFAISYNRKLRVNGKNEGLKTLICGII